MEDITAQGHGGRTGSGKMILPNQAAHKYKVSNSRSDELKFNWIYLFINFVKNNPGQIKFYLPYRIGLIVKIDSFNNSNSNLRQLLINIQIFKSIE